MDGPDRTVQSWRSVVVMAVPLGTKAFTDEDYNAAEDALYNNGNKYGLADAGFSSTYGLWEFSFHDGAPEHVRMTQVMQMLLELEIECEITADVVWTILRLAAPLAVKESEPEPYFNPGDGRDEHEHWKET